ncbi:MAG TPA: hypothetical protein VFD18_06935 [Chthoniobacterales bacterium]|jgi:hypothetical protein|nr:hypothetical protein [Chthoniobacterales bacterium]
MTSWIEPPPKQKGMGCLGKGCVLIIAFLLLLAIAFVIGVYVGTKPKPLPQVQATEEEQNAVRARWDEFDAASRNEPPIASPAPQLSPTPDVTPVAEEIPSPAPTPPSPNRIELTAADINALISRGRHTRGRGYVSIENDVAHVQVTLPLDKIGFRGRYLNGSFDVHAPPDRNPRNLQIRSISGLPDGVVNSLLGTQSVQSHVDEFVTEHGITSFTIENNRVILETNGTGR